MGSNRGTRGDAARKVILAHLSRDVSSWCREGTFTYLLLSAEKVGSERPSCTCCFPTALNSGSSAWQSSLSGWKFCISRPGSRAARSPPWPASLPCRLFPPWKSGCWFPHCLVLGSVAPGAQSAPLAAGKSLVRGWPPDTSLSSVPSPRACGFPGGRMEASPGLVAAGSWPEVDARGREVPALLT